MENIKTEILDNKNKIIAIFKSVFAEKEIILRNGAGILCLKFSPMLQGIITGLIFLLIFWLLFASGMYFLQENVLSSKQEQVSQVRNSYNVLISKVGSYRNQVKNLERDLEKEHLLYQSLLKNNNKLKEELKEKEKLLADNQDNINLEKEDNLTVDNKIKKIEKEFDSSMEFSSFPIAGISGEEGANVNNLEIATEKMRMELNMLKAEREDLKKQVKKLEITLADMQDAQSQVFDRVSKLAQGGIEKLQESLKGISSTITSGGYSLESLLKEERRSNSGQGGRYIPVKEADLGHPRLNDKLSSLNTSLSYWDSLSEFYKTVPLGHPLDKIIVTCPYGYRKDPFTGRNAFHEGIDLRGKEGDKIYSPSEGVVTRANRWGNYGLMVEIDHGFGVRTRYGHMSKISVKEGDKISSGQVIGLVGNTGRSTGPHLHYEVRLHKKAISPYKFLNSNKEDIQIDIGEGGAS